MKVKCPDASCKAVLEEKPADWFKCPACEIWWPAADLRSKGILGKKTREEKKERKKKAKGTTRVAVPKPPKPKPTDQKILEAVMSSDWADDETPSAPTVTKKPNKVRRLRKRRVRE